MHSLRRSPSRGRSPRPRRPRSCRGRHRDRTRTPCERRVRGAHGDLGLGAGERVGLGRARSRRPVRRRVAVTATERRRSARRLRPAPAGASSASTELIFASHSAEGAASIGRPTRPAGQHGHIRRGPAPDDRRSDMKDPHRSIVAGNDQPSGSGSGEAGLLAAAIMPSACVVISIAGFEGMGGGSGLAARARGAAASFGRVPSGIGGGAARMPVRVPCAARRRGRGVGSPPGGEATSVVGSMRACESVESISWRPVCSVVIR